MLHEESPLTNILDNDSEVDESNLGESCMSSRKIPKPKGEAGKRNSGGYNLQEAMGWEDKEFAMFTVSQANHVLKHHQIIFSTEIHQRRSQKKNSTRRFVTVNRSTKIWTKLFNQ